MEHTVIYQIDTGRLYNVGRPSKRKKPVFAINIMARRKALGWNGHRLAEEAEIPYPTLRDIEAGINAGREETKAAIAKALGCSIADMYEDGSAHAPVRPSPRDLKKLIEEPDQVPHTTVSAILAELLRVAPEIRASVLAVLYDEAQIATPYLDKAATPAKAR